MLNAENKKLLSLLKKSNKNAFKAIHTAYGKFVHVHALAIVKDVAAADDILQEVFIQLWEERKRLQEELSLKAYLVDSVKMKCELYLLDRKQMLSHMPFIMENSDVFSDVMHKELLERIHAAILHVYPPACREILWLHVVEQKSYQEIAAVMNIQVAVVRNQICKARKVLRIILRLP